MKLPQNLIDSTDNEEKFKELIILGLEIAKDIFNSEPEYFFLHRVDELIKHIKNNI